MLISRTYLHTSSTALLSFFYIFIRTCQAASEGNLALSGLRMNWPAFQLLYQWSLKKVETEERKDTVPNAEQFLLKQPLTIQFESVSFSYGGTNDVLSKLNLNARMGDFVLIRGESGRGKSTLIALMLGVLDPTAGRILINGTNIQALHNAFAKIVGYVGPEPFLIPGSVRENLLYGNTGEVTEACILNALKDACILDEVMSLNRGLDEPLNEMTQLSTGQKQRLAIARAYLRAPKILIWDEATANLDHALEMRCIENLVAKHPEILVVVISHKNSFDQYATTRMDL
jgi:ABC-type bacteriocin/lantibiotic exporter with double-glycine peptidase domain